MMTDPWAQWWADFVLRLGAMTSRVILRQLAVLGAVLVVALILDRILARFKARWVGQPSPIRYRLRSILWTAKFPFFTLVLGKLAIVVYAATGRPIWTLKQLISLFWFITGYALLAKSVSVLLPPGDARRFIRRVLLPLLAVLGVLQLVGLISVIWIWSQQSTISLSSAEIPLADIWLALVIVVGSWILAGWGKTLFLDTMLPRTQTDPDLAHSVAGFVHFAIIVVGFWIAATSLGLRFSNLTLLISALTVGIGFGLQDVIRNVMGGIILLGEGHVKPKEVFRIAGETGVVERIGIRSTTVRTWDGSLVIVPNADLIAEKVADLTDVCRIDITVGVSCDADPRLAEKLLHQIASAHPDIVDDPAPSVLFSNLGESTFDFILYCYVDDRSKLVRTKSDLLYAIVEPFREHELEMPYRQLDLHLRSGPWKAVTLPSTP
jgi:small-conductance mechanosensitive channel